MKLLCTALLIIGAHANSSNKRNLRSLANAVDSTLTCHISLECTSTDKGDLISKQCDYQCSPVENGVVSDFFYNINLPADFVEQNNAQIVAGTLFADIPRGQIVNGAAIYPFNTVITVGDAPESFGSRRRRLAYTTGTRSLLVLRISSNDAQPGYSASEIYNYIFDDSQPITQPSLKSQYSELSFGKLNLVPAQGGVIEVHVNMNANGGDSSTIRDAAINAVMAQYNVPTVTNLADHVMLCIPPGTGDWAGSSPVNSWRMTMNDQWCGFLSGTMHEMGHNLGLLHSNQGNVEYMDFTSYMSAGYATPYYPSKSFNGANNAQFGWYSDRQYTIDPAQGGQMVTLATFVDYNKSNKNSPVLIQVGNSTFLQYNRAKDFNYQQAEAVDQVTVIQQLFNGTSYLGSVDPSTAQLTLSNFEGSGRNVVVSACGKGTGSSSDPDWMTVTIGYDRTYCTSGAAALPTPAPVRAPTPAPVRAPTPAPATCSDSSTFSYFVSSSLGNQNCAWLATSTNWKSRLCLKSVVRNACRRTCGACNSSCKDKAGTFSVGSSSYSCAWLAAHPRKVISYCSQSNVAGQCPLTCQQCS